MIRINISLIILIVAVCSFGCGASGSGSNTENAPVSNAVQPRSSPEPGSEITTRSSPVTSGEEIKSPRLVEFRAGKVPEGWRWIDPASDQEPTKFASKNGRFDMRILSGRDMYGDNQTAPRLVKAIAGDFQIETRVRFDPKRDYQGAGLVVIGSDSDYLRFERAYGGVNDGGSGIRLDSCVSGRFSPITTPGEVPTEAKQVDLKLIRRANVFTAFWRLDENGEWREAEEFESAFPESVLVGIIGCNTSDPIDVEFEYIRLLPQRVERPF